MTTSPKEKADELVEKYKSHANGYEHGEVDHYWDDLLHLANAKACALIAVDEIIAANVDNGYGYGNVKNDFWYQVKEAINQL